MGPDIRTIYTLVIIRLLLLLVMHHIEYHFYLHHHVEFIQLATPMEDFENSNKSIGLINKFSVMYVLHESYNFFVHPLSIQL